MSRTAVLLIIVGLILVACGTRATELRPTFEPTATFDYSIRAQVEGDDEAVTSVPTATPTMPSPTATSAPTEAPTEAPSPTAVPTEVSQDLPGDPENGEWLFNNWANQETSQFCVTCHNAEEPIPGTGPYLYGIANVATDRVPELSAEEYLRQSILNPNDFIAPSQGDSNWAAGVMPDNWNLYLTAEDIDDIVAYLLTLDQELPE